MGALWTDEILRALKFIFNKRKVYYNVIPCDYLRHVKADKFPICLVVNQSPSSSVGSHWLAVYVPCSSGPMYFVDSYGLGINYFSPEFIAFAKRLNVPVVENIKQLQCEYAETCGYYAIYFLSRLYYGCGLMSLYHHFSRDLCNNDKKVESYCKRHYMKAKLGRHNGTNLRQCCTPFDKNLM